MVGVLIVSVIVLVFVALPAYQAEVFRMQEMAREATIAHQDYYFMRLEINRLVDNYGMGYLDFLQIQVPELLLPECDTFFGYFLSHYMGM